MEMLCDKRIDCAPGLLTNYSAEGAEPFPPFFAVVFPEPETPIDQEWQQAGCLYLCRSFISQEDANLCALRQAVLCTNPPGEEIWFSAPATCTATCPDGTVFYYTVPAGMFIAKTFAEALAQAQAYACLQAQQQRFCLGDIPRCACVGNLYSASIGTDINVGGLTWTVSGLMPPGIQLVSTPTHAVLTGTPLLAGTYAFQITATDSNGNYAIKIFTIQVVFISTTVLDPFVIGTPYSFQLAATGGSGNYNWRVATGTLPDGLTMSLTGLISGTPTASATGGTLTFEVIDLTCESIDRGFFTPRVTLTTVGTTRIETKRGWPDYGSGDILYKKLTVTGDMTQTAFTAPLSSPPSAGGEFCGGAKYIYSGYSEIDIDGNLISTHRKDLFKACIGTEPLCKTAALLPDGSGFFWTFADGITTLLGYCWDDDPGSCPTCSEDETDWQAAGNFAVPSQFDFPTNMIRNVANETVTSTVRSYSGGYTVPAKALFGTQGFPEGVFLGGGIDEVAAWMGLASNGTWSLTLSDEYTDANANDSAVVYTNNSRVAENRPNYLSFNTGAIVNRSSRTTSVNYALNLSNLVVGEDYIARVQLWSSNGAHVTVSEAFTAVATTHTILGSVPNPAPNTTITVKNPSVIFAP